MQLSEENEGFMDISCQCQNSPGNHNLKYETKFLEISESIERHIILHIIYIEHPSR